MNNFLTLKEKKISDEFEAKGFLIRNIEDQMPYDEPSIVRITQKASEFEKILDKDAAMGYINEQFRKKYRNADGGYLYYIDRAERRQNLSESEG